MDEKEADDELDQEQSNKLANVGRRISVHDNNALRETDTKSIADQRLKSATTLYRQIISNIGEDPNRQGTLHHAHPLFS